MLASVVRRLRPWIVSLSTLPLASGNATANTPERISLDARRFAHITLGSIPPTQYANDGGALTLEVARSASFLLMSFDRPRTVRGLAMRWKSKGTLHVATARAEETKAGDDYRLRVGLLVAGEPPILPFFAPAWSRAVRDHLKWPSDRIVYIVGGARHPAGASWKSPHSNSIDNLAAPAVVGEDGWTRSRTLLRAPLRVVGLWIMADGDDSRSSFRTVLADLVLE